MLLLRDCPVSFYSSLHRIPVFVVFFFFCYCYAFYLRSMSGRSMQNTPDFYTGLIVVNPTSM